MDYNAQRELYLQAQAVEKRLVALAGQRDEVARRQADLILAAANVDLAIAAAIATAQDKASALLGGARTSAEDGRVKVSLALSDLVTTLLSSASGLVDLANTTVGDVGIAQQKLVELKQSMGVQSGAISLIADNVQQLGLDISLLRSALKILPVFRSGLNHRIGFREPANGYVQMTQAGGKYDQLEAWIGRKFDVYPVFISSDLFNTNNPYKMLRNYVLGGTTAEPKGQLQGVYDRGAIALFGMPLMMQADKRRFDLGATGAFNDLHRAIAKRCAFIAAGRPFLLRLGWECNQGYWWSWIGDEAGDEIPDTPFWRQAYIDTMRQLATVWREEMPQVEICWNHLRNTRRNVGAYYPGRDFIDTVTMDPYDNGIGGYVVDEASWVRFAGVYANDSFNGPVAMAQWAADHGLRVGFDEYGCWNKTPIDPTKPAVAPNLSPTSPTNNGFYVRKMFGMIAQLEQEERLSHEAYFQTGSDGRHQIWPETPWNANVRMAYLDCFRPKA